MSIAFLRGKQDEKRLSHSFREVNGIGGAIGNHATSLELKQTRSKVRILASRNRHPKELELREHPYNESHDAQKVSKRFLKHANLDKYFL